MIITFFNTHKPFVQLQITTLNITTPIIRL